jgi:hypothetical protein
MSIYVYLQQRIIVIRLTDILEHIVHAKREIFSAWKRKRIMWGGKKREIRVKKAYWFVMRSIFICHQLKNSTITKAVAN